MSNPDPRRELATLETCDTYLEFGVCTCYPKCEPTSAPDPLAAVKHRIAELRGLVFGISSDALAKLPELERRLITETRAHLAEYDRAERTAGVCRCGHTTADHRNNDWSSCQFKGCDCAGFLARGEGGHG
jgi:hypothetical protein